MEVITYAQPRTNHNVQPVELPVVTVNGDIRHEPEPIPVPVVVATPEPAPVPRPRPQIDPTEQSVLISPTLEAPKRRVNYTGMRYVHFICSHNKTAIYMSQFNVKLVLFNHLSGSHPVTFFSKKFGRKKEVFAQ